MHIRPGVNFVKQNVMVPVPKQFDIVIGTNSGYRWI